MVKNKNCSSFSFSLSFFCQSSTLMWEELMMSDNTCCIKLAPWLLPLVLLLIKVQCIIGYPNTSEPLSSDGCSYKWKVQITKIIINRKLLTITWLLTFCTCGNSLMSILTAHTYLAILETFGLTCTILAVFSRTSL